jgi:hypothetical protein
MLFEKGTDVLLGNAWTRVLALGLFWPTIGDQLVDRGMEGVIASARASFAADPVVSGNSI